MIGISKIGGERIRFNSNVVVQVSGLRHQRPRVPAARRPADHRQLAAVPQREAEPLVPQPVHQLQSSTPAGTPTATGCSAAATSTRSVNFINNWSVGGGGNLQRPYFDDRATRGGPGVYIEGYKTFWSWFNTDNRKPISLNEFNGMGRDGDQVVVPRPRDLRVTYRPMPAITVSTGVRVNRAVNDAQWIGLVTDARDHYVFGRTRSDDRRAHPALQLHDDAEPVAAALRGAVRLGGRLRRLQGAGEPPQPRLRRALLAVRLTAPTTTRTST